jgi:hypothetical protein
MSKTEKLKVVQKFSRLPDEKKIKFTQENLDALKKILQNPNTKAQLFKKILTVLLAPEKANVSQKDIEMMQQILVSILFSTKPEYMYDLAEIIDLLVGYPLPENFEERKKYVKSLKWFHIGLPPELWEKVNKKMDELGSVENFFIKAVELLSK